MNSITAIHRLRRAERFDKVEAARTVFVSTNVPMGRVANAFMRSGGHTGTVPVVYTDSEFATIAWLKSPTTAPELPLKIVIADSYAALNPPDSIWRSYLFEIDRLQEAGTITDEEYSLLRFTTAAKSALLGLTRGQRARFEASIVPEVLEQARRTIVAEAEPQLVQRGRDAALLEAAERIRGEVERREESERRRIETEGESRADRDRIDQRVKLIGFRAGRLAYWLTLLVGVLVVVLISFLGSSLIQPDSRNVAVLGIGVVLALGLGVVNIVTGGSVAGLARRIELTITRMSEERARSFLGIPKT